MEIKNLMIISVILIFLIITLAVLILTIKNMTSPINAGTLIINKPLRMVPNMGRCCDQLPESGNEHTYLFWIFVDHWEQTPKDKYIFKRQHDFNKLNVVLGKHSSNLEIFLTNKNDIKLSRHSADEFTFTDYDDTHKLFNLPLQTWNHLGFVCYDKTLDLYLNGKLARTFLLAQPLQTGETNELISFGGSDDDTFSGFLSRFRYFPRIVSPREVYKNYLKGPAKKSDLSSTPIDYDKMHININIGSNDNENAENTESPTCGVTL